MRARTLIGAGLAVALAGTMQGYGSAYGPGYGPGSDIQSNRTNNSPVRRFIVNRHNGFYRAEGN